MLEHIAWIILSTENKLLDKIQRASSLSGAHKSRKSVEPKKIFFKENMNQEFRKEEEWGKCHKQL